MSRQAVITLLCVLAAVLVLMALGIRTKAEAGLFAYGLMTGSALLGVTMIGCEHPRLGMASLTVAGLCLWVMFKLSR